MSDDRANRSESSWAFWLADTSAVLVLYVLGIGPVAWLALHTGVEAEIAPVAMVIYAPVVWLYNHTFLQEPLDWYIHLWIGYP